MKSKFSFTVVSSSTIDHARSEDTCLPVLASLRGMKWSTNTAHRTLGTEIATIYVGPKRKAFKIHKKLLCDRSDYFSKAFNSRFQEANGEMHCPEDDPTAFGHLVNYFYRNAVPQLPSKDAPDNEHSEFYEGLSQLFFLAEKLCMNELSNKTMDTIQDYQRVHNKYVTFEGLTIIYRNTHENSKFRMYGLLSSLRVVLGRKITENDLTKAEKIISQVPDIAKDYLLFQMKNAGSLKANKLVNPGIRGSSRGYEKCFFHTHAEGEICHLGVSKRQLQAPKASALASAK
jgi:hypothetical protein